MNYKELYKEALLKGNTELILDISDKAYIESKEDIRLFRKGEVLNNLNRNDEAIKIFKQIKNYDKDEYILYKIGMSYFNKYNENLKNYDYNNAIKYYKKANNISPNDIDILNNLGLSYLHKGDFVTAIKYYKKANNISPNDIDILNNLGMAYYYINDIKKSTEYFIKALDINPNDNNIKRKLEINRDLLNNS